MQILFPILGLLVVFFLIYLVMYQLLDRRIKLGEHRILDMFLAKISKIPAVIEVMRPYVIDEKGAFALMTQLHSESMIYNYTSIPMILEQNARINDQYAFLMKLSMAIPELQKNSYFIYIREYVMSYDRTVRTDLLSYNTLVRRWNLFIKIKNWSIIGYVLPGRDRVEV